MEEVKNAADPLEKTVAAQELIHLTLRKEKEKKKRERKEKKKLL
ncbi:MAG: hypothetical protein V2I97_21360 [Desulfococcaceae bacterium]|nr:hypothetical protein [Desulfococcaceae bacterium]